MHLGSTLGRITAGAVAALSLICTFGAAAPAFGATNPMCLDVGNSRENGDTVNIYRCAAQGHANQNFVIQRGQIKVENTIGTSREMCLDVGNSRENGDAVNIYRCAAQGHANQNFVIQRGQIKVEDTL